MEFTLAAYTDPGVCKPINQDSFALRRVEGESGRQGVLAVVCDGMGGLDRGEVASGMLMAAAGTWFDETFPRIMEHGLTGEEMDRVRREISQGVAQVDRRLVELGRESGSPLGTTLALFLAVDGTYLTAHVGDSRVYEITRTARRLTRDHSLVEREVALGNLTPQEALHHPQRNVLLRCVGAQEGVEVEFGAGTVAPGGLYLLCSDGFVHALSPQEMAGGLSIQPGEGQLELAARLQALTECCKERGERDNITAVAVRAGEERRPCFFRTLGRPRPGEGTHPQLRESQNYTAARL